jgi:hypothetical protein
MSCVWQPLKVKGLSIKDRGAISAADILLIGHFGTAQQVHLFQVPFMANLPN